MGSVRPPSLGATSRAPLVDRTNTKQASTNSPSTNHQPTTPTYLPTNPVNHHHTHYLLWHTYTHRMYAYVPRTARTAPITNQPTGVRAMLGHCLGHQPTNRATRRYEQQEPTIYQ